MQKQDFFLWGFMACVVTMLVLFHLTEPPMTVPAPVPSASALVAPISSALGDIPLHEPPRPFLTREVEEVMHRDQFFVTGQKCEGFLCVTCSVSADFRRILGEIWTYCAREDQCIWLNTTDQMEKFHVPFGACERDEVPPIDGED